MAERIPDETLVEAFCRGDESAFDEMVARYSDPIARLVNRLLGWSGDVDDVTQEVFLAAYIGLKRFHGQCSLKSWLFTIAINKCRSHARRQWVRRKFLQRMETLTEARSPATGRKDGELMDTVSHSLRRLPARYREPVVLYYLEGQTVEGIGVLLNLSPNTVRVRLHRARQRLREMLDNG